MKTLRIVVIAATVAAWTSSDAYITREQKDRNGLVVQGPHGPADLTRGQQAAAEGRVDDARRDLEPLAERGYVEAELGLGRLYLNMEDTSHVQEAISWLRKAAASEPDLAAVPLARALVRDGRKESLDEAEPMLRKGWVRLRDPEALGGLIRLYTDQPARDHDETMPDLEKAAEGFNHPEPKGALVYYYRRTPKVQGHPDKLIALCDKNLKLVPECYVVLAQAARAHGDKKQLQKLADGALSQYRRGRVPAQTAASLARAMVETPEDADAPLPAPSDLPEVDPADLVATGPAPSALPTHAESCGTDGLPVQKTEDTALTAPPNGEPELANELVTRLAKGQSDAPVLAAGVVVRYPYLAPDFAVEPTLKSGADKQIALAHLYLGELYLNGQRAMRDPKSSLSELSEAADTTATKVEARYYLGRLYQFGYLNEVDGQHAVDHLLWAARHGYPRADSQLARLFAFGRGVCPDLAVAYTFATLGARDGTPSAAQLKQTLDKKLTPQQKSAARALLEHEIAARPKEPGLDSIAAQTVSNGD